MNTNTKGEELLTFEEYHAKRYGSHMALMQSLHLTVEYLQTRANQLENEANHLVDMMVEIHERLESEIEEEVQHRAGTDDPEVVKRVWKEVVQEVQHVR